MGCITTYTRLHNTERHVAPLRLPKSYALCTAEEGRVYTVELGDLATDCVSVSRHRVLGTGTRMRAEVCVYLVSGTCIYGPLMHFQM